MMNDIPSAPISDFENKDRTAVKIFPKDLAPIIGSALADGDPGFA